MSVFSSQLPEGILVEDKKALSFTQSFYFFFFPETNCHILFEQMSATLEWKHSLSKAYI